jgi:hypothetical protein
LQLVNFKGGDRFTAANLNLMQNQFGAYKLSNTSLTSNTTLAVDPDLQVPASMLAPNGLYVVELSLIYSGGAAGSSDIKLNWSGPSGTAMSLIASYWSTVATAIGAAYWNYGTAVTFGTRGSGIVTAATATGTLQMPSAVTSGVVLEWAQSTSSATATTVYEGSSMLLTRIQ